MEKQKFESTLMNNSDDAKLKSPLTCLLPGTESVESRGLFSERRLVVNKALYRQICAYFSKKWLL